MKIALVTPLYPPDIEPVAVYVKELAKRLLNDSSVSILAYSRLPEKVPGVEILSVDKRRFLPFRLAQFTKTLWTLASRVDILYLENGASVELPAALVILFFRKKVIVHIGDREAYAWTQKTMARKMVQSFVLMLAREIITDSPLPRPEILPFSPFPEKEFAEYEKSWTKHLLSIRQLMHYGKN